MKELIIAGLGETRNQCPYDSGIELWSVNNAYDFLNVKQIDKLFVVDEINDLEFDYIKLSHQKCIVSSIPYPDHPEWPIEIYPIREILDHFQTRFFASAIAYMMALAIYQGYERIYFFGIDHLTTDAYVIEKGCVEFWMGWARGMGVEVVVPIESATGKTLDNRMYGYWGGEIEVGEHPDCLQEIIRELVPTLPGVLDESEQFFEDPPGSGNWTRRKQVIRVSGQELVKRERELRESQKVEV